MKHTQIIGIAILLWMIVAQLAYDAFKKNGEKEPASASCLLAVLVSVSILLILW